MSLSFSSGVSTAKFQSTWNKKSDNHLKPFLPSFSPSSRLNDLGQISIFCSQSITEKASSRTSTTSPGKQLQSLLPVCHLKLIRSVIWEWEESKKKRQMLGSRSGLTSMQHCKRKELVSKVAMSFGAGCLKSLTSISASSLRKKETK